MSEHDEPPTEPSAALTSRAPAEPTPATEPNEPDESAAPTPARLRAAFGALNAKRILAVVMGIGLLWLGVWAYTSGSSSSGAVGSVATIAPPPTTAARTQGAHHHKKAATATTTPTPTPAPPTNVAHTPTAYATALFAYWQRGDQAGAARVADPRVVKQLFRRPAHGRDQWVAQGCATAGRVTNCSWVSANHQLLMEVRNPTATAGVLVVATAVLR